MQKQQIIINRCLIANANFNYEKTDMKKDTEFQMLLAEIFRNCTFLLSILPPFCPLLSLQVWHFINKFVEISSKKIVTHVIKINYECQQVNLRRKFPQASNLLKFIKNEINVIQLLTQILVKLELQILQIHNPETTTNSKLQLQQLLHQYMVKYYISTLSNLLDIIFSIKTGHL